MANTETNLILFPIGQGGRNVNLPVDGGSHIYEGSLVSQLNSGAMLVPGSTASSGPAVGVASHEVNNTGADGTKRCEIITDRVFSFANATAGDACSEATALFSVVYMYDDHTIADNDGSATRQPAGLFMGMEPDGRVRVYVGLRLLAQAEAGLISIADAGGFTAETTIEAALQELYQDALSAQAFIPIPLNDFVVVSTGAQIGAFNDGVADGIDWIEGAAYRFNVASTASIGATVAMPPDLDDTADVIVHVLASRVGSSDTTAVITMTAFFQTVAAAYNADTDAGGNTGALSAATTVVQELTRTIAAADVPAAPCALSLTLVPSAALDADDMRVHAVWLEYTRALRAA